MNSKLLIELTNTSKRMLRLSSKQKTRECSSMNVLAQALEGQPNSTSILTVFSNYLMILATKETETNSLEKYLNRDVQISWLSSRKKEWTWYRSVRI